MADIVTIANEIIVAEELITNQIYTIRGQKVMLDSELAALYGVETKVFNQAVRRNLNRFPADDFMFELTKEELDSLRSQFVTLKKGRGSHTKYLPLAFTEMGVAMLSSVLNSPQAISVNIQIIRLFTKLRQIVSDNSLVVHYRLESIERKQIEAEVKQIETDSKFEKVFNALESKLNGPDRGIFFDGEIFDAYVFIANLIKKAKHSIVLIDNYVDESILNLFTKRKEGVDLTIYTQSFTKQLALDLEKHNAQYPPVIIKTLKVSHDRFLILNDSTVYHIGASLKDLGKKWFAFSKMDSGALKLLNRLGEL